MAARGLVPVLAALAIHGSAMAAPCEGASSASIEAALRDAKIAWISGNTANFEREVGQARDLVSCLEEPIDTAVAADLHRTLAFLAHARGDEAGATAAFVSARADQPDHEISTSLLAEGDALRVLYTAARKDWSPRVRLPPPDGARLLMDGEPQRYLPTARPVVLQVVDSAGQTTLSTYLRPGEGVPPYDARTAALNQRLGTGRLGPPPLALAGIAAGAALAAGGLYLAAWHLDGSYDPALTPYEDLGALRAQTNGLVAGSAAAGAIALAAGTWLVIEVGR